MPSNVEQKLAEKLAKKAKKKICGKIQRCFSLPYKGEPDIKEYYEKTRNLCEMFSSGPWALYMDVITESVRRIKDSFGNPMPLEDSEQVCIYNVRVGQASVVNDIQNRAKDIVRLKDEIRDYLNDYPLE